MDRKPLPVEQTNKIVVVAEWLSRLTIMQLELQMAEKWERLEALRRAYQMLAGALVQIVGEFDHLESEKFSSVLLSGLISDPEKLAIWDELVDAGVKSTLYDLFEKPRSA